MHYTIETTPSNTLARAEAFLLHNLTVKGFNHKIKTIFQNSTINFFIHVSQSQGCVNHNVINAMASNVYKLGKKMLKK